MEKLLPEQLQHLWQSVLAQELTTEEFSGMQERLTDEYRATWKQALLLYGHQRPARQPARRNRPV